MLSNGRDLWDNVQLVSTMLLPVITAFFGIWILHITKKIEHSQWKNQKLIEKQIDIWETVGPMINDLYCFCSRLGQWKEMSPPRIIETKRTLDRDIFVNRPFFSTDFFVQYLKFTSECFDTFQGHGVDAKIKSPVLRHKDARNDWDAEWDDLFSDAVTEQSQLLRDYNLLISAFADSIEYRERPNKALQPTPSRFTAWVKRNVNFQKITRQIRTPVQGG